MYYNSDRIIVVRRLRVLDNTCHVYLGFWRNIHGEDTILSLPEVYLVQ
jgi:hypothetical protein